MAPFLRQPARAVRQKDDQNDQDHRRQRQHAQHGAPVTAVAKGGIGKKRQHNAKGDHQLIHTDHFPAHVLAGHLGEVQRRGIRGNPDCHAQHHAGHQQHLHAGGKSGSDRAGHKEYGPRHQAVFTTKAERQPAVKQRAYRRPQHHAANHPLLKLAG